MSQLFVIRHGQASLFSEDYDRLSELGVEQAEALARHWLDKGVRPTRVLSGTLRRQIDSARAVEQAFAAAGEALPALEEDLRFNEYPAEDILRTLGAYLRKHDSAVAALAEAYESAEGRAERYRHLHRLLEEVMSHWVGDDYDDIGMELRWPEWSTRVRDAFTDAMAASASGEMIAVFTSGGVMGVSVQTALAAPDQKAAELNWRILNGGVTRFTFSGSRISLDSFNDVAHLSADQLTYR